MRIGRLGLAVVLGIAVGGIASAQPIPEAKCVTGKVKCGMNKVKGNLGCEGKAAKLGAAVDPLCTSKVNGKFTGSATACMEKLDAKNATVPCATLGDGTTIAAKIDAFIADVKAELYTNPIPTGANACASGKMKCVTNFVKGILTCESKAIKLGLPVDPLCTQKAMDKFTGLALNKSCMEKLEAPGKACTLGGTSGDGATIKAKSQAFMDDLLCELLAQFPAVTQLNITGAAPSGNCGSTVGGPNPLACGLSYTGGGATTAPPTGQPVGSLTRLSATCTANDCTLGSTTGGNDCSDTGCPLGPYRPQPNGATSSCVLVKFTAGATGTLKRCSGAALVNYPLAANVTITGNATQPCPLCVAGLCDATASNPGAACTDVGGGASFECLPAGLPIPPFGISIPNNGTGSSTITDAGGIFCPGQTVANKGCFGSAGCTSITVKGSPAGPLSPGPHPATVAGAFCIPSTGNGVVDGGGGLPGPGASSTPDIFSLF
ncbi:MAG TPA: hypothetical protein VMS22_19205 [Candidatus Eisenbacteria bacterium]|nr:hypothetical protein [Candidatus Eisenbacteria bacterium]